MELDLQSLFGLHVHSCRYSLAETPQTHHTTVPPFTRALLVSQDRRQLFVTPLAWDKDPVKINHREISGKVMEMGG
jgi:hypothetical protein